MADVVTEVAKGQTAWGTPEPERIINCHRDVLIAKEKQMRWRRINRHLHKVYLKTTIPMLLLKFRFTRHH